MKLKFFSLFKKEKQVQISKKSFIEDKRKEFIQQEYDEGEKEKRKAKSMEKEILKRVNKTRNILAKDKILGRVKGKSTHGARGNKNE